MIVKLKKQDISFFKKFLEKDYFLIFVLILAVLVVYSNIYQNKFLWDDEFLIIKNKFIRSFEYLPEIFSLPSGAGAGRLDNFYRPMQLFLYLIIFKIFGLNPFGFHLLNVVIHLANTILIYFLLKKYFDKRLSFYVALLWGVHPINTEAVTYISGTADPLSFLFILISLIFLEKYKQNLSSRFLLFSLLFYLLSLLSKETALIYPIFLLFYQILETRKNKEINDTDNSILFPILLVLPFLVLAGSYFLIRISFLNYENLLNFYKESNIYTDHLSVRIYTFLSIIPKYLSLVIFPCCLHMERSAVIYTSFFSPQVLLSTVLLSSILIGVFFVFMKSKDLRFRYHLVLFLGWFFIFLIPYSGIIPANAIIMEHWLYIPLVGILALIILLFDKLLSKNKNLLIIVVLFFAVILSYQTFLQNTVWKDPITFYNHILKYENGTTRVFNNLAMAYDDLNKTELAEEYYLKAINTSDVYAQPHYNLARLYLKENKTLLAISHLKRSVEINPSFFYSYYLLYQIYYSLREYTLAEYYYNKYKQISYYYD